MTRAKKKRRRRKPNVINVHHVVYDPEIVAHVYQGEHLVLTHLQRRTKNISKGFINCLKLWLEQNEHKAMDITRPEEKRKVYTFKGGCDVRSKDMWNK
jgi:hypothetical protein